MKNKISKMQLIALVFSLTLMGATFVNAQNQTKSNTQNNARQRTAISGQKMKISGVVVERAGDRFVVRDLNGVDTNVALTDATSIKEKKSNPFRGAKTYYPDNILRGLNVEVEGRGDANGDLVAEKIKFSDADFRYARTIETRVNPVENRVGTAENRIGQVEQNAQRMSGQLDELVAISNAARGGAKAAQETADAAIAGVNATNQRISALDEFEVQATTSILFKTGSAVLSEEAKQQLDDIAQKALNAKGYVIEITGHTDSVGSVNLNRALSIRRADAVVRYLAENHRIPLRRLVTPYGFGESSSVADNTTPDGRAQNRRVEVKILVSKGLVQPVQVNKPSSGSTSMSNPE
jgi:outer membrane protein OmpA-like peptidoglycan-associated protein